jgi:hypothetical protein
LNNQRIEIDGVPITIQTTESQNGFRTEILPLTDANTDLTIQLLERANAWSKGLSAGDANSSVRCVRDGKTIIVESTDLKVTPDQLKQLGQQLTHTQKAAGAGQTRG